MPSTKNVLERYLPGIPSQRLRRNGRRPIVAAQAPTIPSQGVRPGNPECPVSDTYADGVPEEAK